MDDTTPRERRAERTRKTILDTAMQLIVEKGPDNLSLREVARRIDYSPAGLYEYFGSKDELIEATCHEADIRMYRYLHSVPLDLPIAAYMTELGMAYIRFARENPEYFLFLFSNRDANFDHIFPDGVEHFEVDGSWTEEDPNFALLFGAVHRAIEEGVIYARADYQTVEISYTIWALVHGMAMLQAKYMGKLPVDFPAADRNAIQVMIEGLGQPPPDQD